MTRAKYGPRSISCFNPSSKSSFCVNFCYICVYIEEVIRKKPRTATLTTSNINFKEEINMINWKVRIKNKSFWIALIPAVLLLVQVIAAVFGYTLDLGELGDRLLAVVNALFAVLTILGIVTDPTTAGIGDSKQALTYETPKKEDAV